MASATDDGLTSGCTGRKLDSHNHRRRLGRRLVDLQPPSRERPGGQAQDGRQQAGQQEEQAARHLNSQGRQLHELAAAAKGRANTPSGVPEHSLERIEDRGQPTQHLVVDVAG